MKEQVTESDQAFCINCQHAFQQYSVLWTHSGPFLIFYEVRCQALAIAGQS